MRKHTLLGLALASALALGTTVAVAAPGAGGPGSPGHGWHGHHGGGQMMMLHRLNLSDAQKASIKQIVSTSRAQDKPQREALRQQRSAFESMTPNQVGYQAAAASLAQAEGQATQARVQQMANLRAQIYAVLTPQQQAQAATFKQQAQERRAQWKQFKQQNPVSSGSVPSGQ
ncbi:MAG: Spy/CpxP family protein refolding chaperone [Rhodanobacter sp.]